MTNTIAASSDASVRTHACTRKSLGRGRWLASAAISAAACSAFLPSASYAVSTNWTNGAADDNWFTAGNWTAGAPPTAADTANLTSPGTSGQPAVILTPGAVAGNVNVAQTGNFIAIDTGGTLMVSGTMNLSAGGASAALSIMGGGGATIGTLNVSNTSGVAVIGAGTTLNVTNATIGQGSAGTLRVNDAAVVNVGGGTGTLVVGSGANGTLLIGNGGAAGTVNAANVNLGTLSSSIDFDQFGNATFAANITGSGFVDETSIGNTVLTGTNTYSGGTKISGTITIASANALGIGTVTFRGTDATLRSSITAAIANSLTINNGVSGRISAASGHTLTLGGNVTDNGGITTTLHFGSSTDNGSVILAPTASAVVNGGGFASVDAGILVVGSSQGSSFFTSLSGINVGSQFVLAPATLDVNGFGVALNELTGTLDGTITNNGSATTIQAINATNTEFAGTLQNGTGTLALQKTGNGTLTLLGSSSYTGGTIVSAGTLSIGNGGSGGAIAGNITDNASLVFNRSGTLIYSGVISGTGTVTKLGSGTVTLAGDSTYTGATTITAGTLRIGNGSTTGSIVGDVTDNATLSFNRSNNLTYSGIISGTGNVTKLGAGTLTLTGTNTYSGGTTITTGSLSIGSGGTAGSIVGNVVDNSALIFNRSDNLTFSGVISGVGVLKNIGGGTLILSSTNTYSGGTVLNAGVLNITADDRLGASGGALTLDGGTLQFGAAFNIGSSRTITVGAGGGIIDTNGFGSTLGQVISGTGALTKLGAGTLTLTTSESYSGGTIVNAGTLLLGGGGALASGGNLTVNGGTFDLNGQTQAIADLSGAGGTIALGSGALTAGTGNSTTYAGVISGTGSLTKSGAGVLTLSGVNTYTGGTTATAGTLQLGNGGTSGSIVGNVTDNATLAFNRSDAITFGGVISGTGALQQNGTGTTTLTAANTYTGGTTVTAGTLQIGAGGTSGSILNNVTDNATLAFNRSDAVTFGGIISGTGAVQQNGTGTTALTGANTYTGGSTISAGTLSIGNGGTAGSIAGNVTDNATLAFNRAGTAIFGGVISGTGAVQQNGAGSTTLTGANTYTGGTTISAGTLILGNGGTSGSITGNVTDNATLAFNRSDAATFVGVISGTGAVQYTGTGTTTLTGANTYTGVTTISAGTLQLGSGGTSGSVSGNVTDNATLAFNRSDAMIFSGVISGSGGVTQSGAGTATLTAANAYTGATVVNAGILSVNGSIASSSGVTVNAGATLGGTGTVAHTTINGGTLAPGNSVGTIAVNGSLVFNTASIYAVEISPSTADRTNVTGAASIAGTLQTIATGGTYTIGTQYTVLAATGGVTGTFSNLSISGNFGATRPRIAYDANDVFIVLDPNAISPFLTNGTPNQTHVAGAIDTGLQAGNRDLLALFSLPTTALPAALDQLTGELHASIQSTLAQDSDFVRGIITDRLSAPMGLIQAQAGTGPTDPRFWIEGFGSWGKFDANSNTGATQTDGGGVFAGVDANFGMLRGGVALGYSHANVDVDARVSTADIDTFDLAAYGGAQSQAWDFRFGGDYAWHRIKTDRTVAFSGFADSDTARYDGETGQVFGELGYIVPADAVTLEPYAGLAYVHIGTDAFRESGGAAALTGAHDSNDSPYGSLGITAFSNAMQLGAQMLSLHGRVAWQHVFHGTVPTSTLSFASTGAGFVVSGAPIPRDSAHVELGLDLPVGPMGSLGFTYTGQFADGFQDNGVMGHFSYRF